MTAPAALATLVRRLQPPPAPRRIMAAPAAPELRPETGLPALLFPIRVGGRKCGRTV